MISNPSYRGHVVTPPPIIPDQWSLNANITSVLFWPFIEVPHISVHGERSTSLGIKVGPQTPKTLLNTLSGGQRGGFGLWSTLLFLQVPPFKRDSRPALQKTDSKVWPWAAVQWVLPITCSLAKSSWPEISTTPPHSFPGFSPCACSGDSQTAS